MEPVSAKDDLIRRFRPCLGVSLVLLMVPLPVPGPPTGRIGPWAIELIPEEPVEGRFVQMVVRERGVTTLIRITGTLAGQAVRFESDGDGRWHALAARVAAEYARAMRISDEALTTRRLWEGPFARPRPTRITSAFGTGREFNGEIRSRHLGTDLAGNPGALVVAPNRAAVALVDSTWYGGNVVYLNHGAGVVTAYLHLSRILVAEGDTVETGTPIGRVGATGRVTGPHLHWIARYGRVTVDPVSLDALDLTAFGPRRTR